MSKRRKVESGLYCVCKQPNDGTQLMLQCDFCDNWFHPQCVELDDDEVEDIAKWHCPGCIDIMSQNPTLTGKGLLGFQGRVAPKEGWGEDFPVTDIDEATIHETIETKRHKIEGWNLFREGRIVSLSSNKAGQYIYFRGQCNAAMRQKTYDVYVCFKDGGKKLKWSTCSCPAGIDGQCKHIVCLTYYIIDLFRQGISTIPDVKTCTDKLQMWHVRKPTTDEPLLFGDIYFIKHDPLKVTKRELCSTVKHHNPIPEFANTVTSDKLKKLVKLYDTNHQKIPVIETIRSNNYVPVLPKQQATLDLQDELFLCVQDTTFAFPMKEYLKELQENIRFGSSILINLETAKHVEKKTRLQSKNSFWFQQRQHRITASNFGTFCRLKPTTDPVKTFKQKKMYFTSRSVKHGIDYEAAAFAKFAESNAFPDSPVGLIVNPALPFLGASPDRLILDGNELKLVEIKCPYSVFDRKIKISNQINEKNFYLKKDEHGALYLSKSHDYFYQIQGQLNICGVNECVLIVFVPPDDIVTLPIQRDITFFEDKMLPKLSDVYFKSLLPHFLENLKCIHEGINEM